MGKIKEMFKKYHIHPAILLSLGVFVLTVVVFLFADTGKIRMLSILLWTSVVSVTWLLGSSTALHAISLADAGNREKLCLFFLIAVLILLCIVPMGIAPDWNGQKENTRDQYERITEALLKGQLYFDEEVDPRLLEMENPYDTALREAQDIDYQWDQAFYNGKYYMYFGVVPVFLLYLPYRLITGMALTGYHGTQVFTAIAMVGMFLLMKLLAKVFFKKMRFATYASLAAALSLLSLWYSSTTPSLYCTAISAAIMLMVWSLYFFVKAVFDVGGGLTKQILLAFCGSWCGALAFGCRPPVALANLLIVPLLVIFLKQHKMSWKLFGKLVFAASPYLLVAVALMTYNYVRFENPFEFGQAYQLTVVDQSAYGSFFETFDLTRVLKGISENFLDIGEWKSKFPYITFSGVFINFPILLLSFGAFVPKIWKKIKDSGLNGWVVMLFVMPILITVMDVQWAPFLMERYRMDIYFIISILCFLAVGFWDTSLETEGQRTILSRAVCVASFLTVLTCCFLWLIPNDANATEFYANILDWAERIVLFDYMN